LKNLNLQRNNDLPKWRRSLLFYFKIKKNQEIQLSSIDFFRFKYAVMNGWEFLDLSRKKNYKRIFKETKVIVLSSTIDPDD
jgi:hypothetical protein